MRRVLISLAAVCVALPLARAADADESCAKLKIEYKAAMKQWREEFKAGSEAAAKQGETAQKAFRPAKPDPIAAFSLRFLAIAERNPEGPEAVDALRMTLGMSLGYKAKARETRAKATQILRDYYVTKPQIKACLRSLLRWDDDDARRLVADVIARNPDRKIQAFAYQQMIAHDERLICALQDERRRTAALEKSRGKAAVAERIAKAEASAERAKAEMPTFQKVLREQYAGDYADLSNGQPAPEVICQDLDREPTSLSALKGKVVVLDIWATWCGPCRAMIPQEREMVARLKDKPFQLVGISIDDEVSTLKEFLAKEKLPWTHWWAGPGGWEAGIVQDWDIHAVPAIFVIDTKGIVRYTGYLHGDELENAVNTLLAEIDD